MSKNDIERLLIDLGRLYSENEEERFGEADLSDCASRANCENGLSLGDLLQADDGLFLKAPLSLESDLNLDDATTLSDEAAKALAWREGDLSLDGADHALPRGGQGPGEVQGRTVPQRPNRAHGQGGGSPTG